jgi:hypothetical protein
MEPLPSVSCLCLMRRASNNIVSIILSQDVSGGVHKKRRMSSTMALASLSKHVSVGAPPPLTYDNNGCSEAAYDDTLWRCDQIGGTTNILLDDDKMQPCDLKQDN